MRHSLPCCAANARRAGCFYTSAKASSGPAVAGDALANVSDGFADAGEVSTGSADADHLLGRMGRLRLNAKVETIIIPLPNSATLLPTKLERRNADAGFHGTFGDTDLANAVALRRAKELPDHFGHTCTYGWPVVWCEKLVFIYMPNDSGSLQIDVKSKPRVEPRESAIAMFLKEGVSQHFCHLGDAPGALLRPNGL